ncbi:hypothetical protein C2I27_04140 [Priestia megaterium]|uniref:hypothetical protein n=1 Tax=Priestia megaterium TaxID=1404 RepID=UPI000D508913|nr:hypothetical protein [Priestia megaterium]PVC75083.1 hypothetical protein C2I27_04140 [Priestia megaterium]
MATIGQVLTIPELGWKRYDDNDPKIVRTGNWAIEPDRSHYMRNAFFTNQKGATLTFSFNGTKIRLITPIRNGGSDNIKIEIDGVTEFFSEYATNYAGQILAYEKTNLSSGNHTVKLTNAFTNTNNVTMSLDAIDIDGTGFLVTPIGSQLTAPEPGWKRYDDIDSAIQYSPGYLSWALIGATGLNYKTTPRYTGDPNARITFDFIGTKIRLIQRTYPADNRSGQIEIDGKTESFVSTIDQYQTLVYEKTGLENKRHSVTITWLNDNKYSNAMDAIDIDSEGRLLHPDEITNLNDLNVGKRIRANYMALQNQVGTFSKLGEETTDFIPITSSATPNGDFYFIMTQDKNGRKTLVADRNIQHSISWDTLNNEGIASGSGLPIDFNMESFIFTIRILTGGVSTADKDNEWDKWIFNSLLNDTITPGDNNIWNWSGLYSWTSTSPNTTQRVLRGNGSASNTGYGGPSNNAGSSAFRPVLEIESNFILKNYSFIYEDHMYKKYVDLIEEDMAKDTSYLEDGSLLKFSLNKYAKKVEVT